MIRLLLVEDDDLLRPCLRDVLTHSGFSVMCAINGLEAIACFKEHTFAVVILDMLLPIQDGLETIPEIQRVSPKTAIVAITGGGFLGVEELLTLAAECGAHACLSKPFTPDELISAIGLALQNRAMRPSTASTAQSQPLEGLESKGEQSETWKRTHPGT
jgi:DNA-binding response OmpR family regulator